MYVVSVNDVHSGEAFTCFPESMKCEPWIFQTENECAGEYQVLQHSLYRASHAVLDEPFDVRTCLSIVASVTEGGHEHLFTERLMCHAVVAGAEVYESLLHDVELVGIVRAATQSLLLP